MSSGTEPASAAIGATLDRLGATFASGRTRAVAWRLAQLDGLLALLGRERAAIEQALAVDLGRAPVESYLAEIFAIEREIALLRRGLPRWSRPERARVPLVLQPGRASLRREPLGTVAVIGPWNYPVNLVLVPLAAAVTAGNCVVVKPSEMAPATSSLLERLLPAYLDPDAVAVCPGGPETSEAIIDGGVDHVFFTGSGRVGALVMERAARRLTPVTLELGGKSPVYVDDSADIAVAARRIAWGKLINAGQSCIAPDFVLVAAARHDELVAALAGALRALYGDDPRASPDYGRIVNARHVDRLAELLEDHGGQVVVGGEVERAARYVAPTLIDRPAPDSALMREEIFGPLLPVLPVAGVAEAAAFLAARPSPLALYVFAGQRARADALVEQVRSGAVCINTTMHHFAAGTLPFGGVGASGMGRYHGRFGFEQLSQLRPVLERATRPDPAFAYPPFGQVKARLLRRGLRLPVHVGAALRGTARRRRTGAAPRAAGAER